MRGFRGLWVGAILVLASGAARAEGPSFDCAKARQPAEFAICGDAKLSELDRILSAGYNFIKSSEGLAAADEIGRPYYFERLACGADVECIAKSQINEIEDLASAGAPVSLPSWLSQSDAPSSAATYVPLAPHGGTLTVPVTINDQITLNFIVDSGAADVSVPADVVLTLMRTGSLNKSDFLGEQVYRMADGSTAPSQTFNIRTLRVGDRELHNVVGSIAPVQGSLLLGQSFLRRFASWSIDNAQQALVLH